LTSSVHFRVKWTARRSGWGANVAGMDFQHVDVFADTPFTGNSLTVFLTDGPAFLVTAAQMLSVTREFRHFESIFLQPTAAPDRWRARVFDLEEELGFAGHPVLGAAAVLHDQAGGDTTRRWTIELPAKTVTVQTTFDGTVFGGTAFDRTVFHAVLDQGRPEYGPSVTGAALVPVLDGIGLGIADLVPGLAPAVVSTGLRYLVIPVSARALARAAIAVPDFAGRLAATGAQFVYLLDPDGLEGRHWTNDGRTEDVATGSAAGTVGAYLARAGRAGLNQPFVLHQGRFTGRPSQLQVEPRGRAGDITQVLVGGQVALVAKGTLRSLPGVEPRSLAGVDQ
jgi:trans-2,3-dihydro-3-hydroxyanthranilate isomerase